MAARAEPVGTPHWYEGRFASWLTTVDHKRIGILYIWTSLLFFAAGGILALLMRSQLALPNEHVFVRQTYNELVTIHGTTMVFLVVVPVWAGLCRRRSPRRGARCVRPRGRGVVRREACH